MLAGLDLRGCPTQFQNRKHIGSYWDIQNTSLSKFNQEHDGKRELETLGNKSVVQKMNYNKSIVQKMNYNKNCDRVFADLLAPCLIALTFIYINQTYC